MAAIVQVDNKYQTLSRKIGYSVGVEYLATRVKALVSLYSSNRGLSMAAFKDLVKVVYEREEGKGKTPPFVHFANFYSQLNLIRIVGNELEPLYQLDSLSILKSLFQSQDAHYDAAVKVVLAQSIVEADADIFLNALSCDFEPPQMKELLLAMVEEKWQLLGSQFRAPQLLATLRQFVAIKNQSPVSGSKSKGTAAAPNARFAMRGTSLSALRRTSSLDLDVLPENTISDDYLRKVSASRKSWAIDLGLWRDGERTEQGKALLLHLREKVVSVARNSRSILFWGYKSDLTRIRVDLDKLNAKPCEAWDLLGAIALGYLCFAPPSESSMPAGEVVDFLESIFQLYKTARKDKTLIRHSLPLYVAEPVLVSWFVAQERSVPPLYEILEEEFKKRERRRVQKMMIRDTIGALFFMSS